MKLRSIAKALITVIISICFIGISVESYAESKPAPAAPAKEAPVVVKQERYDIYIHKWIAMPDLSGRPVGDPSTQFVHKPTFGRVTVAVFLASWCETCQEQMEYIRRLEEKYSQLFTDFVYIFVSDLDADVAAFSEEFKIVGSTRIHGDIDLLKSFKNPPLPSIYIADRFGWIGNRYLIVSSKEVDQLEKHLKLMTAF
jgi:thiol-disulfide isomerase/thioredoxin